jgi:hypothetical protein
MPFTPLPPLLCSKKCRFLRSGKTERFLLNSMLSRYPLGPLEQGGFKDVHSSKENPQIGIMRECYRKETQEAGKQKDRDIGWVGEVTVQGPYTERIDL